MGDKVVVLSKSGKAAVNVKGMTIEGALGINFQNKDFEPLTSYSLSDKIKKFKNIEYICIDEISLVDKKLFG